MRAAGFETPGLDARLLLRQAAGLSLEALLGAPERALAEPEAERLEALARRRLAGEPVARILGHREFWGLDFALSPETLVPRPETETLVEVGLDWVGHRGLRQAPLGIADLGTGTGCVLAALLYELPKARGIGIDRSEAACRTARRNLARHGFASRASVVCADWMAPLGCDFDLIVANPPYIAGAELAELEVRRFDPPLALDGGADGLEAYRALIPEAVARLGPEGLLALEIGLGQSHDVAQLAQAAGLAVVEIRSDLASVQRVVAACRPEVHPRKLTLQKCARRDM